MSDQFKGERATCWCGAEGEITQKPRWPGGVFRILHDDKMSHAALVLRDRDSNNHEFAQVRFLVEATEADQLTDYGRANYDYRPDKED